MGSHLKGRPFPDFVPATSDLDLFVRAEAERFGLTPEQDVCRNLSISTLNLLAARKWMPTESRPTLPKLDRREQERYELCLMAVEVAQYLSHSKGAADAPAAQSE